MDTVAPGWENVILGAPVLDIILAGLALLFLSPLLLPIVVILRLTLEVGEIFYVQSRAGRDGKRFGLYKFATMLRDSPRTEVLGPLP